MKKIAYALLKYYRSPIVEECMYVGILFQDMESKECHFYSMKNYHRLEVFDDDLNIEFVKSYLSSIKEEVETSIFNYDTPIDIQKYINTYVNEFRFSEITITDVEDEDYVSTYAKLFMAPDFPREERLSEEKTSKYIYRVLRDREIQCNKKPIEGSFYENLNFDIQTDSYAIKIFNCKDKNMSKLVNSAKLWSYNAKEIGTQKKVIFIYDVAVPGNQLFDSFIKILSENSYKTMQLDEAMDFLTSIN